MADKRPQFRVQVYQVDGPDNLSEPEEMYSLAEIDGDIKLSRLSFATLLTLFLGGLLAGCGSGNRNIQAKKKFKQNIITEGDGTVSQRMSDHPCGTPIPPGATCSCNCIEVFHATPSERAKAKSATRKKQATIVEKTGKITTNTTNLPCGTPIPPGAICTCNCVPVYTAPSYGTRTYCSCDQVCTCNQVCTCIPVV